jgi:hypothetical protein
VALFGGLVDGDAYARADFLGFQHDAVGKGGHQFIVEDAVHGRAGQRADRVGSHIAPELEPDVFLDLVGHWGLEAGFFEQRGKLQYAGRLVAGRLADDEFVAEMMVHLAGFVERAARMHHAADDVSGGNRLGDLARWVD